MNILSTVSGGSISGITYALMMAEGKSFSEFRKTMVSNLLEVDLVKHGLNKLKQDSVWKNPLKKRNLINAFAEIYHEVYTEGATVEKMLGQLMVSGRVTLCLNLLIYVAEIKTVIKEDPSRSAEFAELEILFQKVKSDWEGYQEITDTEPLLNF